MRPIIGPIVQFKTVRGHSGPFIALSNATVADDASAGDTIGTLSVVNGTGTYTFTLTSNPDNLFSISGSSLHVAAALSAGSYAFTVKADNGAGSVVTRPLLITVTHVSVEIATPELASNLIQWNLVQYTFDSEVLQVGDIVEIQVQEHGGDWSSLLSDISHTVTSDEVNSFQLEISENAPTDGDMDARARLERGTSTSDWSVTYNYTVPTQPVVNAPVLTDLGSGGAAENFKVAFDNSLGIGDTIEIEAQASGGDWSSLVADQTYSITSDDVTAGFATIPVVLSIANYDVRARGIHLGSNSPWSNVLTVDIVPAKSYTMVGASDATPSTTTTTQSFPIAMTGKGGRLIFYGIPQNTTISSVVYDPAGSNVELSLDHGPIGGFSAAWFSADIPGDSGAKEIVVTYAVNVAFFSLSGIAWLATGLSQGFDSAIDAGGVDHPITIADGDLLFAVNYSPVNNDVVANMNWAANSTQAPTGNRLSDTSLPFSNQFSSSADWVSPSLGSFVIASGANGAIYGATYK